MDAGHPTVARPWPEVRGEVEGAGNADRDDAARSFEGTNRDRAGMRQDVAHHVERNTDDDDVRKRPERRRLTERNPADEHEHAEEDRRAADVEATVVRNPFG